MSYRDPRNVLITGASAGLGAALALAYAVPGVTLILAGRDAGRLQRSADACRARGARVVTAVMDVTDHESLRTWIAAIDAAHPLDLVIANAGTACTQAGIADAETWADIRRVFDTNLYGALATVHPAMERMRARGRGQIALMSSLGAYIGMPVSPAYNGSKAAIKIYGEGLRGWLAPQGVGVTVICPGFVETAMSAAYPGPRPFLVSAERAAAIIKRGLMRNPALIAFPFPLHLGVWLLALLPPAMSLWLQRVLRFG